MLNLNKINKVRRILKAQLGLQTPPLLNGSMQWNNGLYSFTNPYLDRLVSSLIGNPFLKSTGLPTSGKFNMDLSIVDTNLNTSSILGNLKLLGNYIGMGADFLGGLIPKDYSGKYGTLLQGGDQAFDAASSAVMAANPMVGGIMKAGGFASDILTNYAGMGTDNMTKTDAILGSKLLSLTPMGMLNGFFGKRTQDFSADNRTLEQVGGSYGGSVHDISNAVDKANKKYGLFSGRARRKANNLIDDARKLQNLMAGIADEAADRSALAGNTLNYIRHGINLNGGYDLRYIRAAKLGGKLKRVKKINFHKIGGTIDLDWVPEIVDSIETFEEGGNIEWKPTIILLEGGKTRTIDELIEYAKLLNPRFIQRLSEPLRYVRLNFKNDKGEDEWYHATHEMTHRDNVVFPMIQEVEGKLKRFENEDEAYNNAVNNNNILKFNSTEEAELFSKSGEDELGNLFGYKKGWADFFKQDPTKIKAESELNLFKEGGKTEEIKESLKAEETTLKNVIPEGALHAHKHNMENAEDLTKKGIPVVDNDGNQLAEIERDEWTMSLKLTKTIEDLYNLYNEDISLTKKDELAIEAGKILVYEILENTIDRTGLIAKCENGGVINGAK